MLARAWGFLGLISATLVMTGFFLTLRHAGWHPGAATGPGSAAEPRLPPGHHRRLARHRRLPGRHRIRGPHRPRLAPLGRRVLQPVPARRHRRRASLRRRADLHTRPEQHLRHRAAHARRSSPRSPPSPSSSGEPTNSAASSCVSARPGAARGSPSQAPSRRLRSADQCARLRPDREESCGSRNARPYSARRADETMVMAPALAAGREDRTVSRRLG